MLPTMFQRRRFSETDQSETIIAVVAMFVNDRDKMSNPYRDPSIDASYQVSVQLAKQFQRRRFLRNQPIINNNCLWWPCLLTDWDKMSNLYNRVSDHLAMRFQRRRFLEIGQ